MRNTLLALLFFVVTAPPGSASVLRVRTSRLLPNPTSMISKIS